MGKCLFQEYYKNVNVWLNRKFLKYFYVFYSSNSSIKSMRNTSRKALYAYIIWKAVKFLLRFFFVNGKGYILQFTLKLHRCNVFFLCLKSSVEQKKMSFQHQNNEKIDTKEQHSFWMQSFWLINSYASFEFVLFYYMDLWFVFALFHIFFYYYAKMENKRKAKTLFVYWLKYWRWNWNWNERKKKWNLSSAIEENLKILNPIRILFVGKNWRIS